MKIYIAGPMTGKQDWNFPAFFEAEEMLQELGHEPINPAHNNGKTINEAIEHAGSVDNPNHNWGYYMRRDIPHLLQADALCLLQGWQNSKGATLEVHLAQALGLPLFVFHQGRLVPRIRAIGMSGWARAGKDTVADHLVANYGYIKMSFADPMKEAMVKLNPRIDFGMDMIPLATAVRMIGWEELKKHSTEIRPLLQRFGTEVGREMFGQDFWVQQAINRIPDGSKVVFADVRFPNEANAVRSLDGEVWRINRAGFGAANDHISEHALNDYSFNQVLENDSTLDSLYDKVNNLMTYEEQGMN